MNRILISFLLLIAVSLKVSAIDMPLTAVNGNQINLASYHGKWIVINYWATWCPPCIEEMPELQAFHNDHVDSDAMVIGINAELIGKLQLQTFLDDFFITYPIFISGPTQESELGLIPGLPTTFLVTPKGKVVARQVGPVTREMIEGFIQEWQSQ